MLWSLPAVMVTENEAVIGQGYVIIINHLGHYSIIKETIYIFI